MKGTKIKTIQHLFSGSLFPDTNPVVLDATIIDTTTLTSCSYGFQLLDNGEVVARYYVGGKQYTKQFLATKPRYKNLVARMKQQGWESVVYTPRGNFGPFDPDKDMILKPGTLLAFNS